MKKYFLFPLFILTIISGITACSSDNEGNEEIRPVVPGNGKILIAYFSYPEPDGVDASSGASRLVTNGAVVGSLQFLANTIQEATDADIFRIETVQQYPASHAPLIAQAQNELNNGVRPALKTRIENLDQYDLVFIGYPNWWGNLPAPLYTFLESYDFSGKTIIPFNSHGGSGFSNTISTIQNMQPNATIASGFTVPRDNAGQAKNDIINWLKRLEVIE